MVAYAFSASLVAVDKCGIWYPRFGGLILEFLAVWVVGLDSGGDLLIDGGLDGYGDLAHFRGDLSDVLLDGKSFFRKGVRDFEGYTIFTTFWGEGGK